MGAGTDPFGPRDGGDDSPVPRPRRRYRFSRIGRLPRPSRPSRPGRRTAVRTALAVLAVVASVIGTVAAVSATSAPRPRSAPAAPVHPFGRTTSAAGYPAHDHDVLFIGASYTAGLGAVPATNGYAYLIGRIPGWHARVDAVSGTGYLNGGPHGHQTFADRLPGIPVTPRPDLIVFQGGRNDTGFAPARLRAAIVATVRLAQHRFIGAHIVLLGPIPAHLPVPPSQLTVEQTMRAAAAQCQATFVDPIAQGWITPNNESRYTGRVPAHPDNAGYAYIAARLLDALAGIDPSGKGGNVRT